MEDDDEEEGGSGWLVSFADLMTLLFAAFVVLYGITPRGKSDEVVGISSSIREAFIEIPDEIPEAMRKGEIFKGKMQFQEVKRDRVINPAIKRFNRTKSEFRSQNLDLQRVEVLMKEVSKGLGVHNSLRQASQVSEFEFGFKLKILARILFIPGTNDLSYKGHENLQIIASKIKEIPNRILIEGHTEKLNSGLVDAIELSALRASKIKDKLSELGIDPKRIFIASYGFQRPQSAETSSKNDRVEIKIITQDSGRY